MSRLFTIAFVAGILLAGRPLVHAQFDGGPRYDAHSVSALVACRSEFVSMGGFSFEHRSTSI